jgi:chitin disaccharide deacetylase
MGQRASAVPRLIVTADDFGLSPGVDRGILEAYHHGIVHSTALLVNFPDVADSVARLNQESELEVGMHLNLTAGPPVLPPKRVPSLVDSSGQFHKFSKFFTRVGLGQIDWDEVRQEWRAQIERGLDLGCRFSFLTSHQHVHMLLQLAQVSEKLAYEFKIGSIRLSNFQIPRLFWSSSLKAFALSPFVPMASSVFKGGGIFCNDSTLEIPPGNPSRALRRICTITKQLDTKVYELVCHPGYVDSLLQERDPYISGRTSELAVLVDPRLRAFFETSGIELTTFREVTCSQGRRKTGSSFATERITAEPLGWVDFPSLFAWARVSHRGEGPHARSTRYPEDPGAAGS